MKDRYFREVYYPKTAVHIPVATIDPDIFAFQQMHVSNPRTDLGVDLTNSVVVMDGFKPHHPQFFFHCMSKELNETDIPKLVSCLIVFSFIFVLLCTD